MRTFQLRFILVGITSAFILLGCGSEQLSERSKSTGEIEVSYGQEYSILKGLIVPIYNNPAIVAVRQRAGWVDYYCTGVVISPTSVLTSARCFSGKSNIEVFAPRKGNTGNKFISASAVTNYADFSPIVGDSPDIAILTLVRPTTVAPLKLYSGPLLVNSEYSIVGFGDRAYKGIGSSAYKNSINGHKKNGALIPAAFLRFTRGAKDQIACPGDTGGPALTKANEVLGIVSRFKFETGKSSCGSVTDAYYVSIAATHAWIKKTAGLTP